MSLKGLKRKFNLRIDPLFIFLIHQMTSPGPYLIMRGLSFSPLQGETQRGSGKYFIQKGEA
jgi:hypothetical protein